MLGGSLPVLILRKHSDACVFALITQIGALKNHKFL
jgi:hypothetical protein